MELTPPITRPTFGRTFFVAIGILGIVALFQLGAVGYVFMKRFHATPSSTPVKPSQSRPVSAPTPVTDPALDINDTFAVPEAASPVPLPKPTPITSVAPATPEGRLTEMIEQARLLRDRGDTNTALTRIREAQATSPDNALIISEMAVTYEKMALPDKAIEQWRRIYDLGETAGIYYAAADAKLKASEALAKQQAAEQEVAASGGRDAAGFQPGATLGLGEIVKTEVDARKFSIKIPIKSRSGAKVEVRDVVIQVFFYDMLTDATIVQTNANVSSRWSTLPADWGDGDLEVLEVDYSQAPADLKEKDKTRTERKFFGYVVRVYYKTELQAYSADPVKLLTQYPAPLTLQTDG